MQFGNGMDRSSAMDDLPYDGGISSAKALEPVNDRDEDALDAAGLQLVHDAQPEFGAFVLLEPKPENLLGSVSPAAMQCSTTASNRWRRTLLSRKRPCRFLEQVSLKHRARARRTPFGIFFEEPTLLSRVFILELATRKVGGCHGKTRLLANALCRDGRGRRSCAGECFHRIRAPSRATRRSSFSPRSCRGYAKRSGAISY